jgi:hypothetical protein
MPKVVPALPGLEAGAYPFSQVVEAHGLVFLAGQVARPEVAGPVLRIAAGRPRCRQRRPSSHAVGPDYRRGKATVYLRFDEFGAANGSTAATSRAADRATVGVRLASDYRVEIGDRRPPTAPALPRERPEEACHPVEDVVRTGSRPWQSGA